MCHILAAHIGHSILDSVAPLFDFLQRVWRRLQTTWTNTIATNRSQCARISSLLSTEPVNTLSWLHITYVVSMVFHTDRHTHAHKTTRTRTQIDERRKREKLLAMRSLPRTWKFSMCRPSGLRHSRHSRRHSRSWTDICVRNTQTHAHTHTHTLILMVPLFMRRGASNAHWRTTMTTSSSSATSRHHNVGRHNDDTQTKQ